MVLIAQKSTGTSGTLTIEHANGRVYFKISNSQSATFAYGKSWSGRVNGVNVSGTFDIEGVDTVTLSWPVSSTSASQTVSFTMGATGTQGLGGPTSISGFIQTPPFAPGTPSVALIDTDQASFSWTAAGNGPDTYGLYVSTSSSFSSHVFQQWIGAGQSYRLPVGELSPGTRYYARVRASNEAGSGPYSGVREFWSQPSAPTGLTVTRMSDSQHTLTWTNPQAATSVVVQRSTGGDAWQTLATLTGNLTSFTDKSTVENQQYAYRVQLRNPSTGSAWSTTVTVYTTPAAPTGIAAVRDGGNVIVSASSVPPYATGYDVQDGSTVIASNVALPYTHVSVDPAVPHTYTVRAVRTSPNALASAWSAPSNTVQLLTAPNAPTGLSPNGAVRASDQAVQFKWSHNAVDASAQSAYELRYRLDGGAWVTLTGTTSMTRSVSIGVASVEWQVRTKGAHPDFSPWSAVASLTVVDRPGVAIVQPADAWDASILILQWTWFQAQGRPQSAWKVELLNAAGLVVETRNGGGATSSLQLNTRLTEGEWTVRAQAATGEVWSAWATETFVVTFTPPAEPVLTGVWDESLGGVQLAIAGEQFGVAVLEGGAWYAVIGE